MPLRKAANKQAVRENTKQLIAEGYPPKQAYAIAMRVFRQAAARKARSKKGGKQ